MRQPKPWFRAAVNAWYVEHNSKQIRLGEHPEDASAPRTTKVYNYLKHLDWQHCFSLCRGMPN